MWGRFRTAAWARGLAGLLVVVAGRSEAATIRYETPEAPRVAALKEVPSLQAQVEAKQLPPIGERLPAVPLVSVSGPNLSAGKHGGDIRTLITRNKDVRLLTVYGHARLMAYAATLELVPDILEWLEAEAGRGFPPTLQP